LSIQSFQPVHSHFVGLGLLLFLPNGVGGDGDDMRISLLRFLLGYNALMLAEDGEPVEACRAGFRDAECKALLGELEARIGSYQRD